MMMGMPMQMQALAGWPGLLALAAAGGQKAAEDEEPGEERMFGKIRDYNESGGFGFIECTEAKTRWGMDVFIHRRQMHNLKRGDDVSFICVRNSNGQPQARAVCRAEDTEKIEKKRAERDRQAEHLMKAKRQLADLETHSEVAGKVMDEDEAKRFQASLRKRQRH